MPRGRLQGHGRAPWQGRRQSTMQPCRAGPAGKRLTDTAADCRLQQCCLSPRSPPNRTGATIAGLRFAHCTCLVGPAAYKNLVPPPLFLYPHLFPLFFSHASLFCSPTIQADRHCSSILCQFYQQPTSFRLDYQHARHLLPQVRLGLLVRLQDLRVLRCALPGVSAQRARVQHDASSYGLRPFGALRHQATNC